MSCSFWNMRRRLRQQLGVERAIEEEKVAVNLTGVKKETQEDEVADNTAKKPAKKAVAKNDGGRNTKP